MKKSLTLSIPKPCAEKWEYFKLTSDGGYCSSCNKVVVDFTRLSDEAVFDFFRNKPTRACGRFRPDQLKAYPEKTLLKISPGVSLLKAGFLSLLFILVSKPGSAQSTNSKTQTEAVQYPDESQHQNTDIRQQRIVKGIVKSEEDNTPLPGVNIIVKGTTQGVVSDVDGQFQLPSPLKEGDVLILSFIGLETKEYLIRTDQWGDITINMACSLVALTGEVAVDEMYTTSKSAVGRLLTKMKKLF